MKPAPTALESRPPAATRTAGQPTELPEQTRRHGPARLNVLFVNYGDFTTNSLNHIGEFANRLTDLGHTCVLAVPSGIETLRVVRAPRFRAATYSEVLASPAACFPNGHPADVLHAWTPREGVRKFVIAHQRQSPATRVIVHLEDNEDYLLEAFGGLPLPQLRELPQQAFPFPLVDGLSHPVRYRQLLQLADAVTVIVDRLNEFVPPGSPVHRLEPGVDFSLYQPLAADPELRRDLGLHQEEKVVVFTGSVTYANAPEMQELYQAVQALNAGGIRVRLVRTGVTNPEFAATIGSEVASHVIELGFVEKERLPRLLALADVLVQPGRAGPFNDYRLPSKLPEFLAAGRPVVLPACNIGGDLVDGQDAILLRHGTAEEIAAACRRVFADPGLAVQLAQRGMEFARRRFDLAANSQALQAFYVRITAMPARTAWAKLAGLHETELPLVMENLSATDLEKQLPDLSRAVRQLDADLHERGNALLALRRHATGLEFTRDTLESTRDTLLRDIVTVRAHATEHALQLENENRRIQARSNEAIGRVRRQLEDLTVTAEREITHLQDELYQSEYRLLRLRSSLSWRATAWLRALRRALIDPLFGQRQPSPPPPPVSHRLVQHSAGDCSFAPLPSKIRYHLDAPRQWPKQAHELVIRGWAVFESEKIALQDVRARIGDRLYPGQHGLARTDVGNQLPQWAGAKLSGFRITVALHPSDDQAVLEALGADGNWCVFHTQSLGQGSSAMPGTYSHWVAINDTVSPATLAALTSAAAHWQSRPLISLLMPVYDPPERWLMRAIESVCAQSYPHWELCIADDASTQPHVRTMLERAAANDPRIKLIRRTENGHISAASNSALELVTGEFCGLFDHDDELAPHALHCVAETLRAHPDAEVVYTDEDKLDENGARFDPHFKPDWNPDLLTSQNYFSHLTVYRTAAIRTAGGFRRGFEGAQDWDLALRITEVTPADRIHHIPRVLYRWRAIDGSTAMQLEDKGYATDAARRALEDHFGRTREKITLGQTSGRHWHVRRPRPEPAPLVTLIIPTRNRRELLVACVESIRAKTAYPNYEFLIADNDSDDPELLAFYERMKAAGRFEVLACPGPFNYSALNNTAVARARGELVGLLNNDLEVLAAGWLDEMVAHAVRPDIGGVGAKLYYPDLRIQHAGVITGLGGVAGHAFKGFHRDEPGTPQFRPHVVQNVTAVTAACLVIRKSVYLQVGGFDENDLAVAFNDVDFCLKVQAAGYRNLFTPFAELIHHESASRGAEDTPEKIRRFQREIASIKARWGDRLLNDPAYNPNLTLDSEDFALAYPPRVPPLSGRPT